MKVIAKFTYETGNNQNLSFREGDEIEVLEINSDGLWKGRFNGNEGMFHISMVRFTEPPLYLARVTQEFLWDNDECIPAFENDVVLVLKEDGDEWNLCKRGYNTGYLPTKILKKIEIDPSIRHNKQSARMTMGSIPQPTILPCRCVSRFDFVATSDKEVSFSADDEMIALSSDLKWVYVQHPNNGFGYVPTSYIIFEKEIYSDIIGRYALVIFDYNGDSRFHLNAVAGDIVYVEEVVGSWAVCKVNEGKYIMPFSYLCLLEEYDQKATEDTAFVLADFISESENEISVDRNDFVTVLLDGDKWSLVKKGIAIGYVPTTYLCVLKDGENYALISKTCKSINESGINVKENDIWRVISKEENNVKLSRGSIEAIIPISCCDVRKFEKPIKWDYEQGKKRLEENTLVKEKEISKRDEEEREQREVRYKEKKKVEQKEFLRQTLKMKKNKSNSGSTPTDFLVELERKKMLYESSKSTDVDLSTFATSIKKAMVFTKPTQRGMNNFLSRQHKSPVSRSEVQPQTESKDLSESPEEKSKEPTKNADSIEINRFIFEGLVEENEQLKQQISTIEASQKNLLRMIFVLKDEVKKVRDEASKSELLSKELDEAKQELEVLKKKIETD